MHGIRNIKEEAVCEDKLNHHVVEKKWGYPTRHTYYFGIILLVISNLNHFLKD